MNDSISTIIAFLVGVALAASISISVMDGAWKDEAVKAGHAEYYLDSKYHRQWRWK
jgi:hypothetical protein